MFAANKPSVVVCCLLVLCSTLVAGNIIDVADCTDETADKGKLISVDLAPCPKQPCVFHRGTNVTAKIKFSPEEMVTEGTLLVYGYVMGIKKPFHLEQPDPCKDHGLECPLKAGATYTLEITLPIKPTYPPIKLVAQMEFKLPGRNNYLFCFRFPMKIV